MPRDRDIRATVTVDGDRAARTLRRLGGSFAGLGSAVKLFGTTAAVVGAVQVGRALVGGLQSAMEVAGEYEAALTRLGVILANQGQYSREAIRGFEEFTETLVLNSNATENQILASLAQAKALGASNEVAKKATQAATDLSVATGVDLETAIRQVNRTLGGYAGELGEVLPELKELTREELEAGKAADILLRKFEGAGAAGAKTYQGAVNNLISTFAQLQRVVGGPLTEVAKVFINDALIPIIAKSKDWLQEGNRLRNVIFDLGIALAEFGVIVEKIVTSGTFGQFLSALGDEIEHYILRFRAGWALLLTQLGADSETISAVLGVVSENTDTVMGQIAERLREMKEAGPGEDIAAGFEIVNAAAQELNETLVVSADPIITLQTAIQDFEKYGTAAFHSINAQGTTVLKSITGEVEGLGKTINRNVRGIGVNAALSFGDALVDAAISGEVAFGDFIKKLLADIAKAIVQALILRAILGAATGGAGLAIPTFGISPFGVKKGGLLGPPHAFPAQEGLLIPQTAGISGRDSIPVVAQPGEMVLPQDVTEGLLNLIAQDSQEISIQLSADVPLFVERVNSGVRDGTVRVSATDLITTRARR